MNRSITLTIAGLAAVATLGASVALTQDKTKAPAKGAPKSAPQTAPAGAPQVVPGQELDPDMVAVIAAATPGPMHAWLKEGTGEWAGKNSMWMAPGTEPILSESTASVTSILDGRFTRCEVAGEMPGMGMFHGFGIYGYDNVSKQFQCTWADTMGTGMAMGTGSLSADGKTMTWTLTYNCPITKKPTVMREVDRINSKDSRTMEMWGVDPKSGQEFKMMEIVSTRKAGGPSTKAAR